MTKADRKIAVFDSGLGGISVLRALVRLLPDERFLYFGDSANAPYGSRPTEQVRALTLARVDELMGRGLKAVVIACNTATSAAIDTLRERYPDPVIVGIEPALKPAAEACPAGRIIVMATEVTLREEKFLRQTEQYSATHEIISLPCPRLVEFVERGELDSPALEAYLHKKLDPVLDETTAAIVLGCTHFPFLLPVLRRITGPDVRFFDGSEGTSAQAKRLLEKRGLLRQRGEGSVTIENSLGTPDILALSEQLLELPL